MVKLVEVIRALNSFKDYLKIIIKVLDDPNDNYLYMVFEFVERGAVLDIPTENPLTEDTAWSYFRDTLRGLEYCIYFI